MLGTAAPFSASRSASLRAAAASRLGAPPLSALSPFVAVPLLAVIL